MNITVTKLTDVDLLRKANSFTSVKDSHMSLRIAYMLGHFPIRTQLWWVEMTDIQLFCCSQFVRSHIGIHFYHRSKRTDRGGMDFHKVCEDLANGLASAFDMDCSNVMDELCHKVNDLPNHFDRYAPTDCAFLCNSEALINMARKRLCSKTSKETREIVRTICDLVKEQDSNLYPHLVRSCVAFGVCKESKPCGFMLGNEYPIKRKFYKAMFNGKY